MIKLIPINIQGFCNNVQASGIYNTKQATYDRKHLQYTITIPKNISKKHNLKDKQTVYLKGNKKTISIHTQIQENSIPVTISIDRTRTYVNTIGKEIEYFTTRICIPISIIKKCNLEKQDEFDFTNAKNKIIMHKIPKDDTETKK